MLCRLWLKNNIAQLSLAVAVVSTFVIAGLRVYFSHMSGFMTQDEGLYFYSVLLSERAGYFVSSYGSRLGFQILQYLISLALGIHNVFGYLTIGPLLSAMWSSIAVYAIYRIASDITPERWVRGLSILALPLFYVYSLMTPFALSEPPALAMTMLGIYCSYHAYKNRQLWLFVPSILVFYAAYTIRETFALYSGLPILLIILLFDRVLWKKDRRFGVVFLAAAAFVTYYGFTELLSRLLGLPFSVSLVTLAVYRIAVLDGWTPWLWGLSIFGFGTLAYFVIHGKDRRYDPLFLVVIISQVTLLFEYSLYFAANIDASFISSAYLSANLRYSYAGLPGAFVGVLFGAVGLRAVFSKIMSLSLPRKLRVNPAPLVMLLILLLALGWNVQQGTNLLGLSQSALQEQQMMTSGSFNPIPPTTIPPGNWGNKTVPPGNWGNTTIHPGNQTCNVPTPIGQYGNFSSVSRLSPLYRSQPLMLYQYIESFMKTHPQSKVLVILPGDIVHSIRVRDFLFAIPSVYTADLPSSFQVLQQLVRDPAYSLVLVYGEYFSGYYATLSVVPGYFSGVMCDQTAIRVIPIWTWYEGYLYQLS